MRALAALVALTVTVLTGNHGASHVQVVARDFSYSLSRVHVSSGPAILELVNLGQDAHDLRLQRLGARHIAGTPLVSPGGRSELTVRLVPGRYRLWCSVADHHARGMQAILTVTR